MSDAPGASRPDPEQFLAPLKDFQRRTVDYVFEQMYAPQAPVTRFLVADEVGLGKTLVARGVIARAVDRLWDKVPRIDVIYICSNADIARQNIRRLNITDDVDIAHPSRLTLLPLTQQCFGKRKLNFLAFTPGTSFDLRSKGGISQERALLYCLLRKPWALGRARGPRRVFRGSVASDETFNQYIRGVEQATLDDTLVDRFQDAVALDAERCRAKGLATLEDRCRELAGPLGRFKDVWGSLPSSSERQELVGELRGILARACIGALEPDIIVMDEFQRFRHLLTATDDTNQLAHDLFAYQTEHGQARVLLLSATPYKMYTLAREVEDDHFADFRTTVEFLLDSPERMADFEADLEGYRRSIFRVADEPTANAYVAARERVERWLRQIMVRNERAREPSEPNGSAESGSNAMIRDCPDLTSRLETDDLRGFDSVDRMAGILGVHDQLEYWKSAPHLLNFMEGYVLKSTLQKAQASESAELLHILNEFKAEHLTFQQIARYEGLPTNNAKLRKLAEDYLETDAWRLLWLPPSLPYYAPGPPFDAATLAGLTKALIFSSWRVVPKAIAVLMSYEAERRMVGELDAPPSYTNPRRPLLRFQGTAERLTGMPLFTLMYPCATLAERVDPLTIAATLRRSLGQAPQVGEVLAVAIAQVDELLAPFADLADPGDASDETWYWAALALLDRHHHRSSTVKWLAEANPALQWRGMVRRHGSDVDDGGSDTHFSEHVAAFSEMVLAPRRLGPMPSDLSQVVARAALAGPATCALRSFARLWPSEPVVETSAARAGAARVALGFRSMFNFPETISLLRSADEDTRYWQRVLEYSINGNLQAVLDEYAHSIRDYLGEIDSPSARAIGSMSEAMSAAVSLRTGTPTFDEVSAGEGPLSDTSGAVAGPMLEVTPHRMRTRFAMQFGDARQADESLRPDEVRAAFNSPFRPFVLASTSVGQEGLDFHLYAHRIYHWNLPANPVDMEQREGRIHRYKGHAVRRNVAHDFGRLLFEDIAAAATQRAEIAVAIAHLRNLAPDALAEAAGGNMSGSGTGDPWRRMFDAAVAGRSETAGDMVPWWVYPEAASQNGYATIERHVPMLPLSRDVSRLEDLKRSMALYRMVFGQPRQEDLLAFIEKITRDNLALGDVFRKSIDLSAPDAQPWPGWGHIPSVGDIRRFFNHGEMTERGLRLLVALSDASHPLSLVELEPATGATASELNAIMGGMGRRANASPGFGRDQKWGISMLMDITKGDDGKYVYSLWPWTCVALAEALA